MYARVTARNHQAGALGRQQPVAGVRFLALNICCPQYSGLGIIARVQT